MRKDRQPFGLFLRSVACGTQVYYYSTYDSEGRRKQFSTGTKDGREAMRVVVARLKAGTLVPTDRQVFRTWTADWFDYEVCPFIQGRLRRGFTYSHVHAANRRALLVGHLWPAFGDRLLDSLQTRDIEAWLIQLLQAGKSADFANRCLGTLRLILSEAVRLGLIPKNPAVQVQPLMHTSAEKGILTDAEAEALFTLARRSQVWHGRMVAFWALLTSHLAGLRQGELLGLQVEDLDIDGVRVRNGWDRIGGLKGTKTQSERFVPMPTWVLENLKGLSRRGHVFSLTNGAKPVSPTYLRGAFVQALEFIGIDRPQQVQRHLGTHSLRHGLVSRLLAAGVPLAVVAEKVGHRTLALTANTYHHSTPIHAHLVAEVQERTMPRPQTMLQVVGQ